MGTTAATDLKPSKRLREILARHQILRWADYEWARWILTMFPHLFTLADGRVEFAPYHIDWWEWLWAIEADGARPRPFLNCQPRDTGKSMGLEVGAAALGLRDVRRYVLYCCATQDQADDHVTSIAAMLESPQVARWYPHHAKPRVGKLNQTRGWRVNRLWTAGGFIVDAIGLDKAKRGARLEKERPDCLFLDDIDARHESPRVTEKKRQKVTEDLIPALNRDRAAIAFGQNLIHERSIMADLMFGRADFMLDAIRSGPHVMVKGLKYTRETAVEDGEQVTRFKVTGGRPTWKALTYERLSEMMTTDGERAFMRERQQVMDSSGQLWTSEMLAACRWDGDVPDAYRVCIAVDPKTAKKGAGAETGIIVGTSAWIGNKRHAFIRHDRSGDFSPKEWAEEVIVYHDLMGGGWIVGEKNNGGELVGRNIEAERGNIKVDSVWASRGKFARADEIVPYYERGEVHHCGVFPELEEQMTTPYDPDDSTKLWDRMDALVWCVWRLLVMEDERHYYDRSKHRR